jgi:hypothetical protein
MLNLLPLHVQCVLDEWRDFDTVDETIRSVGGSGLELDPEFSQLEPEARMLGTVRASHDRVAPTMRPVAAEAESAGIAHGLPRRLKPCREYTDADGDHRPDRHCPLNSRSRTKTKASFIRAVCILWLNATLKSTPLEVETALSHALRGMSAL